MIVVLVLAVATLVARGLGEAGLAYFDSWPAAIRAGLACMLIFTGVAHFNRMQGDFVRMVPRGISRPRQMVIATGVFEFLGAAGLCVPLLQRTAGVALVILFVALLPANIRAARLGITVGGRQATPLWWRVPLQMFFIGLTWWSACMH